MSTASANSSGASKQAIGSTNKRSAANAKGSKADEKDSALPKIGPMPLQECFLANNRLKSLEGLEVFSKSLETLDVSGNYLSAVAEAITVVTQLSSLSELHVRGNAIADSEESLNELISAVANKCPAIRAVDGFSFVSDGHLTAFDPSDRAPLARRTGSASSSVEETQLRREDSKEFHTWADDGGGSSSTVLEDRSARRNGTHYSSDSDEDQVSGELETLEENAASSIADQPEGIIAPKLSLKDIKTPEEIAAMETKFTTLLQQCRETLAQTVFMFSDPAQTLSELFDIQSTSNVVHKPTQPPPTNERETLIDKDTEKMRLDLMQKVIQTVSKPEQALPSIAISNIPEKLGSMLTDTDNLPGSSTSRSAKSVKSNYSSTSKKSASASTSSLLGLGDFSLGVEPLKYHGSGLSRHGTKLSKGSKKKAGSNSVGKLRGAVSQSLDMHDADTPSTTIPKMRAIEGTSIMESTEEVEHLAKGSPQYQTTVTRVSTTLDNVNNNESEESDSSSVANSEAYQGEARRKEEFRNKVSEYNTNQIGLHQIHEQSEDDEDDGIQKRYSSTEQRNKPSPSYRTLANGSLIQVGFDSRSLRILRHSDDTTPTGPALLNDLTSRSNPCEALTLEPRENEDNFGCNSKRRGATVVSAADSPPIYRSYSDSFLRMEPSPVAMSKTNIGAHSSGIAIAKHCIPQQDHDSQSVESLSGTVYSYQSKQHDSNSKLSKFAGDVAFASAFLPFEDNTPDR